MNNFVTVKTFIYSYEVGIWRAKLESEGICCFVRDELTIQVYPFLSNALGGVKLQVRNEDVERATQILKDGENEQNVDISLNLSQEESTEDGIITEYNHIYCPFCGSQEISKTSLSPMVFAFSILLLNFPIPYVKKKYHCFHCQKDFKKNMLK